MGQCVTRNHVGPYVSFPPNDAASLHNDGNDRDAHRGQSSSHSGKRRTKGVASSFGFRRRPASSSRAHDNRRDDNGNTGSTEDLFSGAEVLSGRSTPLARPRKQTTGHAQRTNRFGFRQPTLSKSAKVGDVGLSAERAFGATYKDEESKLNNNAFEKHLSTKPSATAAPQTSPTGVPPAGRGVVNRQTVIVTYAAQQRPARSSSAGRPPALRLQPPSLPRPLCPAPRQLDCKSAKQVANNSRKICTSNDGSSREGSATDSGVSTGGEYSPHVQRRRPRNLEMVMKGSHNFHLRELHVQDLDIMDEAVVTEVAVIPLPKLPSSFDTPDKPLDPPESTFDTTEYYASLNDTFPLVPVQNLRSQMSTLERYRTNRVRDRPNRINMAYNLDSKDEEKLVLDRAQPEKKVDKQKSFIKADLEATDLPSLTRESSKESSPSTRSEESPAASAWGHHTAGESMANSSQDDVSFVLSISSSEDKTVDVAPPAIIPEYAPAPHPMLMKSLTLSQHDALRNIMLSSMTSSAYSGASGLGPEIHSHTLTIHDSPFDMTALETSTQSLIDDETSPADSLISSSTDSNNDMNNLDREPLSMSSSAYQTANTKTKSTVEKEDDDDNNKDSVLDNFPKDEIQERFIQNKEVTPLTPGTPSNASNSLSLSDGRDYFDDEIADQPALIFQKNGENNDDSPSIRRNGEDLSSAPQSKKLKDKLSSPASQGHFKGKQGIAERTPSLDTLSSIASDDLMMDVDLGHSITSLHSVDEYVERLDGSLRSGIASFDESQLRQELTTNKFCAVRQWNQLLEQNNALDRQLAAMGHFKQLNHHSNSTSNSSLANIGASLPVRTARLLSRSRAHTPDDAPAALLQDVVDIKTMLLQLKRVLQEPEEEHNSKRSETLDPLLANDSNGLLFLRLADSPQPASVDREQYADLKRQILFLQAQVEERDRAVRVLQQQMSRLAENTQPAADQLCNAATQTDRLRPPMITSSNSTSENSTGLVSWNEQVASRKSSWLAGEVHPMANVRLKKPALPSGALAVKCQCGAKIILNGAPSADAVPNGTSNGTRRTDTSVQLKPNSRVGSRYLQALSSRDSPEPKHYVKRDSSVNDRVLKTRSLNGNARSKSIENFNNQVLTNGANHTKDPKRDSGVMKSPVHSKDVDALLLKHHTSYGDLFNGRINGKDSKCSSLYSNGYTFSSSGQLTDTDDNSDGGYKSLPPSINGSVGKKASGIPRRSVEGKLSPSKYNIKTSAV